MATVESNPAADEIDTLLRSVEHGVIKRDTPAYELGKQEGVRELYDSFGNDIRKQHENTVRAAEIFYRFCCKQIQDLKIKQIRIGTDPATTLPTAVLIVDIESAEHQRQLMDMARAVERFCYDSTSFLGNLWTLIDDGLDTEMVKSDFPLFRRIKR